MWKKAKKQRDKQSRKIKKKLKKKILKSVKHGGKFIMVQKNSKVHRIRKRKSGKQGRK